MRNGAVILAAGSSARMGGNLKKEFLLYRGKPLLYYCVKSFLESGLFSVVLVTCREDLVDETRRILSGLFTSSVSSSFSSTAASAGSTGSLCPLEFTAGGATRQDSVLNSLEFLSSGEFGSRLDSILIHDGARPFVSIRTIERVLSCVGERGASIPVEPSTNTMKMIDSSGRITAHLERDLTRGAQTPQGFLFAPLLSAHRQVREQGLSFTDDSEIWDRFVGPVYTVEGNRENRKITYAEDLSALSLLLEGSSEWV